MASQPTPPTSPPPEIAGHMIRVYLNHWFPVMDLTMPYHEFPRTAQQTSDEASTWKAQLPRSMHRGVWGTQTFQWHRAQHGSSR